ncbi:MAG: PAS domain S-box protein [bacterium]|nr:PAS domain S-box protein [bacterium]
MERSGLDTANTHAELEAMRARIAELEATLEAAQGPREVGEALLETSLDGVVILENDGAIRSSNATFRELSGYTEAELATRNVFDLAGSHEEAELRLERARKSGNARGTVSLRRADGTTVQVEVTLVYRTNAGGRFFIFVRDISSRLASEEHQTQLAHFSRLNTIGEMASGIAHELNQPLSAIVNYTSGALRRLADSAAVDAELIGALKSAAEQARRAGVIIRRMRNFVRHGDRTTVPTSINEIVRETVEFTQAHALQLGVQVDVIELDADDTAVVDPIQIEQVLLNLIRNGLDAMKDPGIETRHMAIEVSRSDGFINVSVADTGCGIAPGAPQDVFAPFVTTKPDGVGLGLSISRSIIETHGGRLWCEPRPETGTQFLFTLPT